MVLATRGLQKNYHAFTITLNKMLLKYVSQILDPIVGKKMFRFIQGMI